MKRTRARKTKKDQRKQRQRTSRQASDAVSKKKTTRKRKTPEEQGVVVIPQEAKDLVDAQGLPRSIGELKDRVEARRHELQASLLRVRASARRKVDDTVDGGRKAVERIEAQIRHAEELVKDGWDKVNAKTVGRLQTWLRGDEAEID